MLLNSEAQRLGNSLLNSQDQSFQNKLAQPSWELHGEKQWLVYLVKRRCVFMESRCTHSGAFGTRQAINEPMKEGGWQHEPQQQQQKQQQGEGGRGGRGKEATLWGPPQPVDTPRFTVGGLKCTM